MTTSFFFIVYDVVYNVNQNKNKMIVEAVEISGTNQPGNGREVLRIETGNQRGGLTPAGFSVK